MLHFRDCRLIHLQEFGDLRLRQVERLSQILQLSGLLEEAAFIDDAEWIDRTMAEFLNRFHGLIILDDHDPAASAAHAEADERLLVRTLSARSHNKLLLTYQVGGQSVLDQSVMVSGFSADAEYEVFLAGCALRLGVPAPRPDEYAAIAEWSGGLPRRLEMLVEHRRGSASYADAMGRVGNQAGR